MSTTPNDATAIKEMVKDKYTQISRGETETGDCGCGCGCTGEQDEVTNIMSDSYEHLEGYVSDADLGLGCGLPTQFARIKKGDTIIDLGSGAGNDCFVARHETGTEGRVIGIDFSESMVDKARNNAQKLGYKNVEFRVGDIEEMPVNDAIADVVVSNCVLNLVPNKAGVFSEIHRVLKPGGHFSISDIVLVGDLPESLQKSAEMYAGCVSGAIQKGDYLSLIQEAGFEDYALQKEKEIQIPDDTLLEFLSEEGVKELRQSKVGLYSITVYASKSG